MPKLHAEPLVFCLAWAALVMAAGWWVNWQAGAILSLGLMVVVMPTSLWVVTRLDDLAVERTIRWGLLAVAAAALLAYLNA